MMERLIARARVWMGSPHTEDNPSAPVRMRVAITGAAGLVGAILRPPLRERFSALRLIDVRPIKDLAPGEHFWRADLSVPRVAWRALAGMDAVVHLAAAAKESPFDTLLDSNVTTTYNVFESARQNGARRVVFGSSMHVMGFYSRDEPFDERSPIRPDSRYAVSKVFGEALARLYVEKHGFRVACLRIGHLTEAEEAAEAGNWTRPADLISLVRIGLEHPDLRFEIFHAVVNYQGGPLRSSAAAKYGHTPATAAETFAAALTRAQVDWPSDRIAQMRQGATFASAEASSDAHHVDHQRR